MASLPVSTQLPPQHVPAVPEQTFVPQMDV
jgi:hypothetical protein